MRKLVKIRDVNIIALVDTGIAEHLVRSSVYFDCGALLLTQKRITLTEFGGAATSTFGVLTGKVEIDDQELLTKIHVVADNAMSEDMIIGYKLIKDVDLLISNDRIQVKQKCLVLWT